MPSYRLALARRVPRSLLGFPGRAFAFGGMLAAVAVVIPRLHGLPTFLLGPCGLGLLALVLVLVASFAEENGGIARLRLASQLRLGALLVLAASLGWGLAVHVPANLVSGLGVAGLATLFLVPGVLHDVATLPDTRLGEPIWCERPGRDALELASIDGALAVRYDAILGVQVGGSIEVHGVILTVRSRGASSSALPLRWIDSTREGDRFFLTERQLGADAADFAARLDAARTAGGYR